MSIYTNSIITKIVNKENVRKFASQMSNHKALLPVIILEVATTGGRTYQAYKRGGMTECRERMVDETITAIIWFGIIEWLNKGFDKIIGKTSLFKKGGLPEISIDMGKDAIRNPIKEAIEKRPDIKNIIGGLKLSKIALASFAGIYLSGVLLPKFYQNMTKKILQKEKKANKYKNIKQTTKIDMQEFLNNTKHKKLSFGAGSDFIKSTAHMLEKNRLAQLLTIDGGLFIGRAKHARNKDEMHEFVFRDCSSSFFYIFSTPLIYKGFSKFIDKFKGKNTNLDPNTVDFITKYIQERLPKEGIKSADFAKEFLGGNDSIIANLKNSVPAETIKITDYESIIRKMVTDTSLADKMISNAKTFINLRPDSASRELLTLSEALNSTKGGFLNNAKFLTDAVSTATKGASQDKNVFVSFKDIDKIKQNIQDYAESIMMYAKKSGSDTINESILQQAKNRNMLVKVLYTVVGLVVSATFLSTIIPKLQYKLTEMRTGKKEFPGIRDIK